MTPAHLQRIAASMADAARRLADDPSPEASRVRGLLHEAATNLARHAAALRRLDDEIDLLTRSRRHPAELADAHRRRHRAHAAACATLDAGTVALLPGGDTLDPTTILRRLGGPQGRHLPYGRGSHDRSERLRRLTTHLLRGRPRHARHHVTTPGTPVTVPTRAARHSRVAHLLGIVRRDRPTGERP